MPTKPQDVVVALKACLGARETYAALGRQLGMSASEMHGAFRRLREARLLDVDGNVIRQRLREFLIHGVPYAYPAAPGELTRGVRTAWAAPRFASDIVDEDARPVWPDPEGDARGHAVVPLYPSVPRAARQDAALYDLLAAVDLVRIGRARERQLGEDFLTERLTA
jgi:hypothetical protein